MKRRFLRILAFIASILLIPYSCITWIINGKKSLTTKLMDFSLLNENLNDKQNGN